MKRSMFFVAAVALLCGAAQQANADPLLYDNGGPNGGIDAWTINFGFAVSNSFTVGSASTVTGVQFATWNYPGDVLTGVNWYISTGPTGGGTGNGNPTPTGIIAQGSSASPGTTFLYTNGYGYNIYENTFSLNVPLGAGTYYLTLGPNSSATNGDPIFWDENEGPSTAYENTVGNLAPQSYGGEGGGTGSESFQVYGTAGSSSAVPEPASLTLLGMGVVSLIGYGVRRKKQSA